MPEEQYYREEWDDPAIEPDRSHVRRHVARDTVHEIARYVVIGSAGTATLLSSVLFLGVLGVEVLPASLIGAVATVCVTVGMVHLTDRI